ncbi:hypothetical protein HY487_01195 [Candidatus Woesearchaeota archaeon]|nr:hypothetical protein [Candidatus Woesearchaeota archaeon]
MERWYLLMDPKEDEEITIDFSKIKNFFKSDKKEEKKAEEAGPQIKEEKKDDDELNLSFDAGKIKKFFKSGGEDAKGDEEIPVNWSRLGEFLKKYGIVFIALIPIILSIYIRIQAGSLPVTDDWAANSVINSLRSQIRSSIDQQYPNLPDANKNALVETELQKVTDNNRQQIDQQIKATSAYFKSFFQDESGKIYMPDIDPYYWFRYAKNIIERGHPGDALKDGKPFDSHQLAPVGRFVYPDMFHSYAWAYFYKFLSLFSGITLMRSGFYLVIFFSALCVLLVFLIARKIAGNICGFFAALMMAVNGAFLSRSLHPDNDVWVVLFPLLITLLFIYTIDAKSKFKIILLGVLAGLFTGIFTKAWSGWWYIFDFLLATVAITLVYLVMINFNELKKRPMALISNMAIRNEIIVGLLYFFSTLLFVVLFSGWDMFRGSFLGPLSFPSIKAPVSADLWPNVFTTVAELNEGSIGAIINSVGGQFLFFISLLGLVLAMSRQEGFKRFDFFYLIGTAVFYGFYFLLGRIGVSMPVFGLLAWIMLPIFARIGISIYKKDQSYDYRLSILLSIWVVSTIFASIKGIRFTLLLAPAFSVAFGVAFAKAYMLLSKYLTKELRIHKMISGSILILMLLLVYITPTRAAINAARSDVPMINDAWYSALAKIKQDSSENAIITSWWDFGHHFKALADRRVTFDGTTQTYPAAHWVGKLLMTDNEKQAIGILRMLDCGNNNAFNELYRANNNTHLSLRILNEVILLDKGEAEKKLISFGLSQVQAEKILSFSHCREPEAYFIASEDMIGKSGVWSHFGSWNFERAEIWQDRKLPQEQAVEKMMKKFNYTREKAENTYYEVQSIASDSEANSWVAPWPGYGGVASCAKSDGDVYICSGNINGLQVNLSNYDVYGTGQQGIVRPRAVAFATENGVLKKEFNGTTLDIGITFVPKNEEEIEAVLSSKELTGSMFTRMFYMQGHGLRYFKLFDHQKGLTGTDIYTYKIDWEGKNAAIVEAYARKQEEKSHELDNNISSSS